MRNTLTALVMAVAACHPANGGSVPAPQKVSVHDVLTTPSLVGKAVEVTGRCLGYSVPTVAKGSPPVTRSDWQLEDMGEAVWVNGPMPPGCTPTAPAESASTVSALVAQDSLAMLGGQKPVLRRYLVTK